MSFVVAAPEQVQTAAQGLAGIHSTLAEASASVAAPTTAMAAVAEDQVSAGVAAMFNAFGQEYQILSAETQAFHAQFVNLLNAGAAAYLSTDIANAQQNVLNAVNAPVQGLLGQSSGVAVGASGGAVGAVTSGLTAAQPVALPLLGGGGASVGSIVGGGTTSVGSILGGLGGGSVGQTKPDFASRPRGAY